MNDDEIARVIQDSGLSKFLDETELGLNSPVDTLAPKHSLGLRKRFALARAMLINGPLVIMDEPTEGLDADGAILFYRFLNQCIRTGRTMIVLSHDPAIIRGATTLINLDSRPFPKITPVAKNRAMVDNLRVPKIMKTGRLTPYLIMLGFVLSILWANSVSIEISANAPGKIIPTGKVRVLQNLEGGIIKKIYVAEGQIVEAGDVLLEFEEVASRSEVSEIEARLAFLRADISINKSLLEGLDPLFLPEDIKNFPEIIDASKQQFYALQQLLASEIAVLRGGVEKNQKGIKITMKSYLSEKRWRQY